MRKPGRPKKIKFQSPKGMHDLLSNDLRYYEKIFDVSQKIASDYSFKRIETPILEQAELFLKGIGISTEVIEKQMYILKTRAKDILALRPEYTASIARSYIEKGMNNLSKPVKLWAFGPCFRYEKPQAGRFRQFWHLDFEVLGEKNAAIDAQIIQLFFNILASLKLKKLTVQINSIGCQKCRGYYRKFLIRYLKSNQSDLCPDCKIRLKTNPLRILDCKEPKCRLVINEGPQILDYLCKNCRAHFKEVLEFLDDLKINYELSPFLVRGLDYYTNTVFEIFYSGDIVEESKESEWSGIALVGGGRYDNLIKILGGRDTAGCGAAAGVERIVQLMKNNNFQLLEVRKPQIFLAQIGADSKRKAMVLFEEFRKANIPIFEAFGNDSLRIQLAKANRLQAKYALILGEKEAIENEIIIRNMETGAQNSVKLEKIVEIMNKKIK